MLTLKANFMTRCRRNLWPLVLATSALSTLAHSAETGTYRVIDIKANSALNVRANHNSSSADIGSASLGTPLEVVGFNATSSWAKVKWEKSFGWVSMRFLSAEGSEKSNIAALAALQRTQGTQSGDFDAPASIAPVPVIAAVTPTPAPALAAALAAAPKVTPAPAPRTTVLPPPATAALRHVDDGSSPSISCLGHYPSWQLTVNNKGTLVFQAPDENALYATTQWQQAIDNKNSYAFNISGIEGTVSREKCVDLRTQNALDWRLDLQTNGFGSQEQLSGCCSSQ